MSTASTAGLVTLKTAADHQQFISSSAASPDTLHTLQFTAPWHEPSRALEAVLSELSAQHPTLRFALVDAEQLQEVTELYPVESVPTFIFIKAGKLVDSLEGANQAALTHKVAQHSRPPLLTAKLVPPPAASSSAAASSATPSSSGDALHERLSALVRRAPLMLFIKGTPDAPRCGFSKQLLALMAEHRVTYDSFDILTDPSVREGLKTFSNWPTFPQVYHDGELLGGLDVIKEMIEAGEFPPPSASAAAEAAPTSLTARIEALLHSAPVLLFMKGDRHTPRCGFSRSAIDLLNAVPALQYATFDILGDEDIRQGLKEYSHWPTYPQLYVNGELLGGLDVMKELQDSGELEEQLRGAGAAPSTKAA